MHNEGFVPQRVSVV